MWYFVALVDCFGDLSLILQFRSMSSEPLVMNEHILKFFLVRFHQSFALMQWFLACEPDMMATLQVSHADYFVMFRSAEAAQVIGSLEPTVLCYNPVTAASSGWCRCRWHTTCIMTSALLQSATAPTHPPTPTHTHTHTHPHTHTHTHTLSLSLSLTHTHKRQAFGDAN